MKFFNPSPQGDMGGLHRKGGWAGLHCVVLSGYWALGRHQTWLKIFTG